MRESLLRKTRESAQVALRLVERDAERLEVCVGEMARRFRRGGRLWTLGNGGSACDAQHAALEFLHPILEKRRPIPAMALCADPATLTAVGNDRDFSLVFAEPLARLAGPGDVVLAITTSGQSPNVVRALEAAREIGLLSVLFAGKDGGAAAELADHAFVVPSFSIHRIQEVHTLLLHLVWDQLHVCLGEEDVL